MAHLTSCTASVSPAFVTPPSSPFFSTKHVTVHHKAPFRNAENGITSRQWKLHAALTPPTPPPPLIQQRPSTPPPSLRQFLPNSPSSLLSDSVREWLVLIPPANALVSKAAAPPSEAEIKLLREALSAIYGEKNPSKAEPLLGKAIEAWERQNADERAGLYRVRGDCYMALQIPEKAIDEFSKAIELLNSPGGELADPSERPAAHLGRARSIRSLPTSQITPQQSKQAAQDYQIALKLTARGDDEDFDSDEERMEDGARRNPYVAWEYAAALRSAEDYQAAQVARNWAVDSFDLIGDRARKVISSLDRGIDLAIVAALSKDANDFEMAKEALQKAIRSTTTVEGRDVDLLQRVIAKEGEARLAFAALLWDNNDKPAAEAMLGEACVRLEQLEVDAQAREAKAAAAAAKKAKTTTTTTTPKMITNVAFSIDGGVNAGQISCSRFKNEQFLTETLGWPQVLQGKVKKLQKLES